MYYKLKTSVNTNETGPVYPQVQKMISGYDYNAPNSVYALSKQTNSFPDYTPNLDCFVVNAKAKLTDILSVSVVSGGFLISHRLKNILEKFNIATHRYYPAFVSHKRQIHKYYWIHIISDNTEYVDYPNSQFFIYQNYQYNIGPIEILSKDDLILKRKKIKEDNPGKTITIWSEYITLTEQFILQDLFEIGIFDAGTYVSYSLKNSLELAHISGCDIESAYNIRLSTEK